MRFLACFGQSVGQQIVGIGREVNREIQTREQELRDKQEQLVQAGKIR